MDSEKEVDSDATQGGITPEALESAIRSACRCLIREFRDAAEEPAASRRRRLSGDAVAPPDSPVPGGFWCGELEADTTLESDYILFLYLLDRRAYDTKIRKLASYIRRHQLEDGSWNIYYGGVGEISASVKAYVALKLAGASQDDPVLVRAREAILRMGGVEAVNSYTKIYLGLLNLYPWKEVPALPPEVVLLPRFFYFNIYEISYWSRAILIPLSILYATWPNRSLSSELTIDEIFLGSQPATTPPAGVWANGNGAGTEREAGDILGGSANGQFLEAARGLERLAGENVGANGHSLLNGGGRAPGRNGTAGANGSEPAVVAPDVLGDAGLFSWRNFFLTVDRVLKIVEKTRVKPLRSLALKKAEEWIVARLQGSDGLGAIFPSMVNSVLAMRSLGYSVDHPLIAEGLEKLEELEIADGDEIRLQPCLSPVWDTALAMNALGEAGFSPAGREMVEGGKWLVYKEVRRPGDWQKRVPNAEVGGWAFQFRNDFYPDIDDTAAVVMALGRVDPQWVPGVQEAMARGINWVLSLQCTCGGWAAFDADVEREIFNQVPYADHNAMLDPACADITGRVLEMLGRFPKLRRYQKVRAAIRRGVQYLKETQEESGAWYGRWGVNYIYGTWQALKGLMAVGEKKNQEYIQRAVGFLKSRQNADGGWGESCYTYDDATTAGCGPSTASQTAWALMGLISAGEVDSPEVEGGVRYLLERQSDDGGWDEAHWTGTGFPSVFYLKYHMYRLYFPLFALGHYRNEKAGTSSIHSSVTLDLERRETESFEPGLVQFAGPGARKGPRGLFFGLLG